jgi:hypothetical protein
MAQDGVLEHVLDTAAERTAVVDWSGGEGVYVAVGTFNGATITLQMRVNTGGTWVSMGSSGALTADGVVAFVAPAGSQLSAVASVATPTSVKVSIMRAPVRD